MEKDETREFSSLDEDDWKKQAARDEEELRKILDASQEGREQNLDLGHDRAFSQAGKADDAQDFEDISDDDLPDEEPAAGPAFAEVPGLTDDTGTSNETDDLFGDGQPSSPIDAALRSSPGRAADGDFLSISLPPDTHTLGDDDVDGDANQDSAIPPAPTNILELVKQAFPSFDKGIILDFNEQLAPKPYYKPRKQPTKPPKPLVPTKLSLDMEVDQEKLFRIPGPAAPSRSQKILDTEARGFVSCLEPEVPEADSWDIFKKAVSDDFELVGGFTLQDIELACFDFDERIDPPHPTRRATAGLGSYRTRR